MNAEPSPQRTLRVRLGKAKELGHGGPRSHNGTSWLLLALLCYVCVCGTGCSSVDTPLPTHAATSVHTPASDTPAPTSTLQAETVNPTPVRNLLPIWTTTSTLAPTPTHTPSPTWTPTPTWTSTPSPTPHPRRPVVAFVSDWAGDDDIYFLDTESWEIINLTHSPGEDRDPVLSPNGNLLAFRSNISGTWAFYRIDLETGERSFLFDDEGASPAYTGRFTWGLDHDYSYAYESYQDGNLNLYVRTRAGKRYPLTRHPSGDYAPAWRPATSQIAFTSWREGQKDLYLVQADGSALTRLTVDPTDEETPAWHPDGRRLVYVRWQDYDADLWELDLERGTVTRLTDDPYPDRSPTYAADGTVFWTRYVPGKSFEVHDPYHPGRWRLWMRNPEGKEGPVPLPIADMDVYTPIAGLAIWPDSALPALVMPTPTPTLPPGQVVGLVRLDIQCAGQDPRVHAHLADEYRAWQAEVLAQSGYDFMGTVSDVFRSLGHSGRDYGHLSWHRTGRAVDLLFEWYDPADDRNRLLVVREDLGSETYWRLYLRCRQQDGTMGEPLVVPPWIFWFNLDPAKEPLAFAAGGKPGAVLPGYYVDLTRLAKRHGWHRIASYEEADFDWRWDSVGREFWHYQQADGLTWWEAMSQIYPLETLEEYYGWTVCTEELGMDPDWLRAKGIPTPTPGFSSAR